MVSHTFAVCAYRDSPYLESCIQSLKRQSVPSEIIVCTSTPSAYIRAVAEKHGLPLYVREGQSDIQEDWNFAYGQADTSLVTIAHQDDIYGKHYGAQVRTCWEQYPDTTVFMADCVILKENQPQAPGLVQFVKMLLRLPLRLRRHCHRTWVKRAALVFGNPVICPSCTYNKEALGEPLFQSPFKFALDWDTLWRLAELPGRFICLERPMMWYRIHPEATTKACIKSHQRMEDEMAMFGKIWPKPVVRLLMHFYRKAYDAYEE